MNGATRGFVLLLAGLSAACSDDPAPAPSVASPTHGPWSVACDRTVDEPGVRGLYSVHYRVTVSSAGGPAAELARADVFEGRDPAPLDPMRHLILRDWKSDGDRVWLLIEQDLLLRVRAYSCADGSWWEVLTSEVLCRNIETRITRTALTLADDGRGVDGMIEGTKIDEPSRIAFHLRIEDGKLVPK